MTGLLHDLRHGARLLFAAPGFAAAAVLTLALAIGANTVIFSVVNLLVIQPLPLGDPDRLGWVFFINPQNAMDRWPASLPEYAAFKAEAPAFESLAGVRERTATLSRQGAPAERVVANVVVGNLFGVWRIRMYQGRGLSAADEDPAAPGVVVLSHRYWSGRFGGEPILDQSLSIDGRPHTVVGIVSPELELGARRRSTYGFHSKVTPRVSRARSDPGLWSAACVRRQRSPKRMLRSRPLPSGSNASAPKQIATGGRASPTLERR